MRKLFYHRHFERTTFPVQSRVAPLLRCPFRLFFAFSMRQRTRCCISTFSLPRFLLACFCYAPLSRLAFYSPRWRILSSWRHFCRIGCYRPYLPLLFPSMFSRCTFYMHPFVTKTTFFTPQRNKVYLLLHLNILNTHFLYASIYRNHSFCLPHLLLIQPFVYLNVCEKYF